MAVIDNPSFKKARITEEQITEMKRMLREGKSISAIAQAIGCHRQTVRIHLKEKQRDIVADEVRKQLLTEELISHFRQLGEFAQIGLRSRLNASLPRYERPESQELRKRGSILLGGMMGLPCFGSAMDMKEEWMRLYRPSHKESHLLQALREHTRDLLLWMHWDNWRRKVSNYESAGIKLLEWVEERTEAALFDRIEPTRIESIRWWLFGNFLLMADNQKHEGLDTFRKSVIDPEGMIIGRDPDADRDGSKALFDYLTEILEDVQKRPEWILLCSATVELKQKESQIELRRIAKDIDYALVSVELMHAFPGHCHLCPV
jgi:hypothetical protein